MKEVPNCFYRVSVKALILNETRDKFLIVQEDDGEWELPGGGLDWGMTPQEDLPREISEEMGLKTTWIANNPSYFLTVEKRTYSNYKNIWLVNVLYEAELENLDFTPSKECVAVRFVNLDDIKEISAAPNVVKLAEMFKAENHEK